MTTIFYVKRGVHTGVLSRDEVRATAEVQRRETELNRKKRWGGRIEPIEELTNYDDDDEK